VEVERAAVDLERAGDDRPGVLAGEAQLAGAGDLDVTALRGAEAVQTDGEVEARVVQRPERDQPADGCAAGVAPEPDVDAQHAVVQDAEGALHVTIPDAHGLPERARAPQRELAPERGVAGGAAERERAVHAAAHVPE